jgi:alpha-ketoglutarate-dependent 2,4-dichlorophenoxyacetate dioxygenase
MPLTIVRTSAAFVARVTGVDLHGQVNGEDLISLKSALADFPVLHFPDQPLTDDELLNFARLLGPLEIMGTVTPKRAALVTDRSEQGTAQIQQYVVDVSNMDENGEILGPGDPKRKMYDGSRAWHSDCTYREVSASYSFLMSKITAPSGGETEFADMTAAYDALPDDTKRRIATLRGKHNVIYSAALAGFTEWTEAQRKMLAPRIRALVRAHPETARKSLLLASHLQSIMEIPEEEGRALIRELTEFATQRRFVYSHSWTIGDLLVWDNRCLMHRGMPYESDVHRRQLRSVRVLDMPGAAP